MIVAQTMKLTGTKSIAGWRLRPSDAVIKAWVDRQGHWQVCDENSAWTLSAPDLTQDYTELLWRPVHSRTWDYAPEGWDPPDARRAKRATYWCSTCKASRRPWCSYDDVTRIHRYTCLVCQGSTWTVYQKGAVLPVP